MPAYASPQRPETEGLLSGNTAHGGSQYRDVPEPAQQNMGVASQSTETSHDLSDSALPKDMQITKPEGRKGDALGLGLTAGGAAVLVVLTWGAILGNNPRSLGLFAFHPTLQTLAIACFAFGILTLQPTSQPKTKKAGLSRHQVIILGLGIPCLLVGTLIIIWNKNIHEMRHFTTWHATFGLFAIAWLVIQVVLGAGSVWFGGAAFGGGAKAKSVWKYHRLSGYLLYPFFLITASIGGGYSQWMSSNVSEVTRVFAYAVAPITIIVGIWSRARLSKMKFV